MDKHDTLLMFSSLQKNRQVLRNNLSGRYNLLEAGSTTQMLMLLEQNRACIAAVVMDFTVPDALDRKLLARKEYTELMQQIPVILIIPEDNPQNLSFLLKDGAADAISLNYDPYGMLCRVEAVVELHLHKLYMETMIREKASLLHNANESIVDALSSIIEYRSVESGQHILRIRHFTRILLEEVARSCPEYQLDMTVIPVISSAAALHDIGKISIPDSILMKPGPLTPEEREIMKTHAITGCRILDSLGNIGDPEYLRYAHNICHYHHERWDGGGYPDGLSGEAIPVCAQVVGLADVYDALTSKRIYKEAFSFPKAVNMILKGECGVFSPKLLECFKHVTDEYEQLARAYADGLSPRAEPFDTTLPSPTVQQENSLERVRAKYFALVHYVGGLLLEVDLNRDLFHLIYNPYPELSWLQEVSTFSDMISLLDERVIDEQGRSRMIQVFREGIQTFMDQDLRRVTYRFPFQSKQHPEGDCFEVTLLRINPIDTSRRTLAVLCRRVEGVADQPTFSFAKTENTLRCLNDEQFTLTELSSHTPMLAGYSREEIKRNFSNQLINLILPQDRKSIRRSFREQFLHSVTAEAEFRVRHKDGSIRWILDRSRLYLGSDGKEYLSVFLADITHTKQAYEQLSDKLNRYEIILAQTENVLFEWDMKQDTMTFSETWEKIFGYVPIGRNAREAISRNTHFHPDDLPQLVDAVAALENGSRYEMVEVRMATERGRYLWCRIRASAVLGKQGQLEKVVGIIINIDQEKQAQSRLLDRAERDPLTRLLNKKAAQKQAEAYLRQYPQGISCAMIIIDLDNFKQVNDQYGHLFGDAVLTRAAREIENLFRNQDILARIGGDEFLVMMRGVAERPLLEARCSQLLRNLRNIFRDHKFTLPLSCSIGISLAPEQGTNWNDLFLHADQALYQAKNKGKDCYVFSDGRGARFQSVKNREVSLTTPIDSDQVPGLAEDNLVHYAFRRLYGSQDVERSIQEILALIGQKMNVSRVYVFENSDDNRFCSNTYEWCNYGIQPQIQNLQNVSYEDEIPGYQDYFNEHGLFYCPDITALPKNIYDILEPQGIQSMLQCAIREGGVFRGYIGFDECVEQRYWTKEQIRLLRYLSEMLSMFLMRKRQQEQAVSQANDLRSILDNQNAWIYIIDPESCRLKYVNAKTRELAPEVAPGMLCYKALMGLEERCPGCPSQDIRQKKNACALIQNNYLGPRVLAEATLIQWQQEESCLLTCREIQNLESP